MFDDFDTQAQCEEFYQECGADFDAWFAEVAPDAHLDAFSEIDGPPED